MVLTTRPRPAEVRRPGVAVALTVACAALVVAHVAPPPAGASTPGAPRNATATASLDDVELYAPGPSSDARQHLARLRATGRHEDAARVEAMTRTPTAVWIESPDPRRTQAEVRATVKRASTRGTVPVLVAYNLPFRDCAQYSAGGARTPQEYRDWVDGFAAGLGGGEAIVVLEPDGLGIIPWYTTINGELEWCQPAEADPATAAADRFAMLSYAVDALTARPGTRVYLDGTHSSWLGVGDAADRLIKAGVDRADGFFVNVSNYRETAHLEKYGTWIAQCIHLDRASWWDRSWCASQYHPADPADFSTWHLTDAAYDEAYAQTGLTRDPAVMPHFVIDTSRNGQGPWTPPTGAYPDPQDWCNPPGRGVGPRPTTDTSNPLLDAYLWVKVPGESDGQCGRGLPGEPVVDPEWGRVDPPAGAWFPEQAVELARLADPPLLPAAG
ncbi:glycoside hydrolase family 6 protein [Thalassiella azotivora]